MDLAIDALILEHAPVLVLKLNNIIEKWNKRLAQLYGWSQSEALGKDADQLLMTVFPRPRDEIEQQLFEKGEWQGDLVQTRKDGSDIVVTSHWSLHYNEQGQIAGILEIVNDITEHSQLEDALSESEYRYKHLVNDSPLAIFQATMDGKAIFINPAFARMFGYQSPEECLELIQSPDEFYLDPKRRLEIIKMIQDHPGMTRFENLYRRKDGSTFWGNLNVRRIENRERIPSCFEGFIEDITERKHSEEILRESHAKLELLFDILPVGVSILDQENQIMKSNPALEKILDVSPEALRKGERPYRKYLRSDGALLPAEEFPSSRVLKGEKIVENQEVGIVKENGDLVWTSVNAVACPFEDWRVVLVTSDITTGKVAEEKLREAERFTQATLDALADHICVLDESGTIISTNRAWREFADANGASDAQYYSGANYLAVCDAAQGKDSAGAGEFAEGVRKVLRHEIKQFSLEYTCDSPQENRWFIASVTYFIGEEKERLVISHRNITPRKQAEEGLRESRERLSRLSYHLVQTQEQERRRIARELHDEIGQTLTAMTIALNSISQAALETLFNQKLKNLKGLASDLIDQVNALSSELRPRVLDDLGLVPGLISMINRLSMQTGIEIDFKHGLLDQKQLQPEIEITAYRIIQEALTNIVRHAGVNLAVVRIQVDEDTLWIQVQDQGKGFDYQSALNSGDSIGLMGMLERAEQIGGIFSIQTAPGDGTNITCRLPLGERFIERRVHGRD